MRPRLHASALSPPRPSPARSSVFTRGGGSHPRTALRSQSPAPPTVRPSRNGGRPGGGAKRPPRAGLLPAPVEKPCPGDSAGCPRLPSCARVARNPPNLQTLNRELCPPKNRESPNLQRRAKALRSVVADRGLLRALCSCDRHSGHEWPSLMNDTCYFTRIVV